MPTTDREPDHVARARVYDELGASSSAGLDASAVRAARANYEILADATPTTRCRFRALEYAAPNSVRLLCTAIEGPDGGDALRDAAASACRDFVDALPPGYGVYENPPASYHSTIFHTGHPTELRPKSPAEVEAEVALARGLVEATPALEMEADRVVLASSGVLLLLLTRPGGGPSPTDDLRVRCRAAWPEAPARQATHVMHVSLCRVIEAPTTTSEADCAAVLRVVRGISDRVRGMRATLRTVWHVEETRIATCGDVSEGCIVTPLATSASH